MAVGNLLMPIQPVATHNEPVAVEAVAIESPATPETIEGMIRSKAHSNNLDEEKIIFVARCESQIEPRSIGDGHLTCSRTGEQVSSRGIWQINNCAHPEISDEQAFDPMWSTDWAMEVFKKGDEGKEWKRCTSRYFAGKKVAKK